MALTIGQRVLDRYVVEAFLGGGGMGKVYRARHHRLGVPVALKVLFDGGNPDLMARFEREAELMARVRHPNVVSILDYGVVDGTMPCIAMEFVEGESLEKRLARRRALPIAEALEVVQAALAGLEAMHAMNVLHRDLKPGNIIIAPGAPEVVKVVDFGIAKSTEFGGPRFTKSGVVVGTPAYMSPEQLLNTPLDVRSDVSPRRSFCTNRCGASCRSASRARPCGAYYEPLPPWSPAGSNIIPAPLQDVVMPRCPARPRSARPTRARSRSSSGAPRPRPTPCARRSGSRRARRKAQRGPPSSARRPTSPRRARRASAASWPRACPPPCSTTPSTARGSRRSSGSGGRSFVREQDYWFALQVAPSNADAVQASDRSQRRCARATAPARAWRSRSSTSASRSAPRPSATRAAAAGRVAGVAGSIER